MALRTPLSVTPHLYMGDSTGRPLDNGVVYFGQQDKDPEYYPITLYSDDALTLPLMQPVNTKGGYLYDKGDMVEPHAKELIYSVKVLDSYGRKVFYKGAMLRNSWNDDVIEQINTAILETQVETAAIAGQVAANAVDTAITDIATAGASQNGWTDLLIATEGGGNQREVNKKTVFEYDTVAAMLADTKIVAGKVVSTNGYHAKQDGGGAKYAISLTPTDYSIPLANGLHAVFNDSFDIRKFGIRDSATLNQDVELLRMRNYADRREYIIDFHGYSIMAPKLDPSMGVGAAFSIVRGLWFTEPHHFKNLKIFSDKINRQNSGICQLIFCPEVDPTEEAWVIFENITLDPWSAEYQPYTENYVGAYDGMRHSIFIHPRGGWNALFNTNQKDYATNYCFKFINIEFLSSAYSYNVTTAGLRSRKVIVDGYKGDSILAINTDTVDLQVKNFTTNTRFDLVESGRLMVYSGIHFEAEHGGEIKRGLVFNHGLIHLENCSITKVSKSGVAEPSGQLFWFTALGTSKIKTLLINNSLGNVELQGISNSASNFTVENVEIHDCRQHINLTLMRKSIVGNITISNSVLERVTATNSGTHSMVNNSEVGKLTICNNSVLKKSILRAEGQDSKIGLLDISNTEFAISSTPFAFVEGGTVRDINLRNIKYGTRIPMFKGVFDTKTVRLKDVIFEDAPNTILFRLAYTEATGKTDMYLDDVQFVQPITVYTEITLSGNVYVNGLRSPNVLPALSKPTASAGINALTVVKDNVKAPESLIKNYTLTDTVPATGVVKKVYPVDKDCKYAALSLSLPTELVVGQHRQGANIVVTLTNNTATPVTLESNVLTVNQII